MKFWQVLNMEQRARDFSEFLRAREQASLAYVRGQPEAFSVLVAEHHDASFFPPRGGCTHGTAEVASRYERDAAAFEAGSESSTFEIFHMAAGDDVAYWTGLQHATVRMKGGQGPMPMHLRVTEVFRREGDAWKLVHRHADMLAETKD